MDHPCIIKHTPPVRGQTFDTRAWLTRHYQTRQEAVSCLRKLPGCIEAFRQLTANGDLYRVVFPPDILKAIREKRAVWPSNPDGTLSVMLRRPTGQFFKHLSLERVNPTDFTPLVQLTSQSMLSEALERLEDIEQKVSALHRGQVADRIGALLGAEDQFREALAASGEERRFLLHQCTAPFTNARGRALAVVQSELEHLPFDTPSWLRVLQYLPGRRSPGDRIQEGMKSIHLHLCAAVRATRYLEELYEELDQPGSVEQARINFIDAVKPFLARGFRAAQWLEPSPRTELPEELWTSIEQFVEAPARCVQLLLEAPAQAVELEVKIEEMLGVEADHEPV